MNDTRSSESSDRAAAVEPLEPRTLFATYVAPAQPRVTMDLDAGWRFLRSDAAGAQTTGFDDSGWSTVNVPHSWNTKDGQDGGGNYYRGIGWYRKTITPGTLTGKSAYLTFQGSSLVTDVYIDGTFVGEHRGAFGAFNFDVTAALSSGTQHLIAVKVDNSTSWASLVPPQSGDFNVNGGIYRPVSLVCTNTAHVNVRDFGSSGVYFSSPSVSASAATVQVRTGLSNTGASSRSLVVRTILADAGGTIVAQMQNNASLGAGQNSSISQSATVTNPHQWNGRLDPYLHDLYVEVRDASTNQLLDLVHERVGIRSYQISATQGFLLNGRPYDLHGVNAHQDRLDKAWAISDDDARQDIGLILDVGATMLRTAHYQQSQLVYDLADQYGLIVWAEVPVCGSGNAGVIPSGSAFATAAQDQLKELIRQDYNHPSIIVWSVYNEVTDNAANAAFVSALNNLAHAEDPTRLTAGASWDSGLGTLERSTDAVGYNRYYGWYYGVPAGLATQLDDMHRLNPTLPIGMSEYGAGAALSQHQASPASVNPSSLWHPEEYQTYYHEQTWKILEARPWLWAKLVWNMFDFAIDYRNEGDTPGRNDKGLVSYDRQTKKDSFYFYKANWSSDPVLYITSRRWTERSSPSTSIKIYSNVDNPVVTINGASKGALVNQGDHVWLLSGVTLAAGNNTVRVTGTRGGQTYTDTVVWHCAPPLTPGTGQIKINFQPADTGPTAAGYLIDTGLVFGNRGGGALFGWNADNTANTRRRNVSSDVRSDTIIHTQRNGTFTWEYGLANGTYDVLVAAGDPSFSDSINSFSVEGLNIADADGQDNFDNYAVRVVVSDGRLTIRPTGSNAKLDFVEITSADATPPGVASSSFLFNTGQAIAMRFDEAIDVSTLNVSDLQVRPTAGGAGIVPTSVVYDAATRTATFSLAKPLPDGDYTATLPAGSVADLAGNPTAHDAALTFFVLAGDANRDRIVDLADFTILAINFNRTGRAFSQGDFNYDGTVDLTDFDILAGNFNHLLS